MRKLNGGFTWNNLVRALRQLQSISPISHTDHLHPRSFNISAITSASLSIFRCCSTEIQSQMSTDLIRIMEQRLSGIEHRSACLENLINQTARSLTSRVF